MAFHKTVPNGSGGELVSEVHIAICQLLHYPFVDVRCTFASDSSYGDRQRLDIPRPNTVAYNAHIPFSLWHVHAMSCHTYCFTPPRSNQSATFAELMLVLQ